MALIPLSTTTPAKSSENRRARWHAQSEPMLLPYTTIGGTEPSPLPRIDGTAFRQASASDSSVLNFGNWLEDQP